MKTSDGNIFIFQNVYTGKTITNSPDRDRPVALLLVYSGDLKDTPLLWHTNEHQLFRTPVVIRLCEVCTHNLSTMLALKITQGISLTYS
jgi:hypothetical protein